MPALDSNEGAPRADDALAGLGPLLRLLALLGIAAVVSGLWLAHRVQAPTGAAAPPDVRFADISRAAGLTGSDALGEAEPGAGTLAGAVVFFDYDNDGRPDLLLVRGRSCRLYHNEGHDRFRDVTRGSGLALPMPGEAIAVGDYDGDGREDLFISGIGGNRLFHNEGGGRFADVTDAAGLAGDDRTWSTGAVWLDAFGDGRLDLVVCHYARWAHGVDFASAMAAERAGPSYGAAVGFVSAFPSLYRNEGGGRFVDASRNSGLERIDRQTGFPRAFPLAVAAVDANGDGRLDLLFAYQNGGDGLYLNEGGGRFRAWTPGRERSEGVSAGLAAPSGAWTAAPVDERLTLWRAAGFAPGSAADEAAGVSPLRDKLGIALLDYDLDGRIDILSGNGRAEPTLGSDGDPSAYAARPELLWNEGRGWEAAPAAPGPFAVPRIVRGVAVADIDGDGRPDVALVPFRGPPILLRNDDPSPHAWLRIDLVARRGPRDGDGARVEVRTPRRVYERTVEPAMGFLAQSEKTLTFGLGDDGRINRIVVLWPDGRRQEIRSPAPNRHLIVIEPEH